MQPEAVDEALRRGKTSQQITDTLRKTAAVQDRWLSGDISGAEDLYDYDDDMPEQLYWYHVLRF